VSGDGRFEKGLAAGQKMMFDRAGGLEKREETRGGVY
jgi:hypothetical protein